MNTQNTLPALFQSHTGKSELCEISANVEQRQHRTKSTNPSHPPHATSPAKILKQNGYRKLSTICNTLQGELYKAKDTKSKQLVAIKRTNKLLFASGIAHEEETTFCVSENIIREALILQYLTIHNKCIGGYIIQFINFFQSESDYYLVIEYIDSQTNLKQFVEMAQKHIQNGTLKLKRYQKTIQYLYWQLAVTIQWLHNSMKCCHLDLCLQNIMLANCTFIQGKDGYLKINPAICVKLVDFGVSECFRNKAVSFDCNKQWLSLDNEPYLAPKVYSEATYDAASADMWSLGMILYECLAGNRLYEPMEILQCKALRDSAINIPLFENGYWSLHNDQLKRYISAYDTNKFGADSFDLLVGLLNIDQDKRLDAMGVLQHKWFKFYFQNYHKQIAKKAAIQKEKLEKQKRGLRNFPFYQMAPCDKVRLF